jgi:hypothetical protein
VRFWKTFKLHVQGAAERSNFAIYLLFRLWEVTSPKSKVVHLLDNTCSYQQTCTSHNVEFIRKISELISFSDFQHYDQYISGTPWGRMFLEKITVAQPVRKFHSLIGLKGPLPCSQKPTTGPYMSQLSTHSQSITLLCILILCSYLCLALPSNLFLLDFLHKTLRTIISFMCTMCPAHPISFYLPLHPPNEANRYINPI